MLSSVFKLLFFNINIIVYNINAMEYIRVKINNLDYNEKLLDSNSDRIEFLGAPYQITVQKNTKANAIILNTLFKVKYDAKEIKSNLVFRTNNPYFEFLPTMKIDGVFTSKLIVKKDIDFENNMSFTIRAVVSVKHFHYCTREFFS